MKAVLISINPQWCDLIASLKKTIEVRKTKPNLKTPFKVYIYCTQDKYVEFVNHNNWRGNGKIIGEFVCDKIETLFNTAGNAKNYMKDILPSILEKSCLTFCEFQSYANSRADKNSIYGWHISNLAIYDVPKELSEFYKCGFSTTEELEDDLCNYCSATDYGEHKGYGTPNGYVSCEGRFCDKAYQKYLDDNFLITRPPQSWCYVESLVS